MNNSLGNANIVLNEGFVVGGGDIAIDYGGMGNMDMGDGGEQGSGTSAVSMDALLSNWFFVGGISGAVFLISVAIGLLLAKRKIKKGFDVYED